MSLQVPYAGGLFVPGGATAAGGTAFAQGIQPYISPAGPSLYSASSSRLTCPQFLTRILTVGYTTGATAHAVKILRPLNWTTLTAATEANGTVINLAADPGAYSTAFRFAVPGSKPANVANNAIAGSDYVAVQTVDGLFHFSKVTSVSTLAVTMTTALPNITGGGAASGAVVYFFGAPGDSDPNTGMAQPGVSIAANATLDKTFAEANVGPVGALHYGDPLLFYSPNTTNAGTLDFIAGYYSKY